MPGRFSWANTQDAVIKRELAESEEMFGAKGDEIEERLPVPKIGNIKEFEKEDAAEVFVNILKSRKDITKLVWEEGLNYIVVRYRKAF